MGRIQFSVVVKVTYQGKPVFMDRFSRFPVTIGRSPSCDISFPEFDFLSSKNTQIVDSEGVLELVDLDSANGTYIGMQKILRYPIASNQGFKIGGLKFQLIVSAIEEDSLKFKPADDLADTLKTELPEMPAVPSPEDLASIQPIENDFADELFSQESSDETSSIPKAPGEMTAVTEPLMSSTLEVSSQNRGVTNTEVTKPGHIAPSWGMNIVQRVPVGKLALEATLKWKGTTIENHVYYPGESVYLNGKPDDGVHMPSLKKRVVPIAVFRGDHTKAILPSSCKGEFFDGDTGDLKKTLEPTYDRLNSGFRFQRDEFRIHFQNEVSLHFRHIESPKPFSQIRFFLPEMLFQKALAASGILHAVIVILGFIAFPAPPAPKVKNLPPRIAKLLVAKPKPKPPEKKKKKLPEKKKVAKKERPKPKKKAKPKRVAKKKPPKRKPLKRKPPKKVIVRKTKKINKFPYTVKTKNVQKRPSKGPVTPQKNVKQIGALAALGALGKSKPNPKNKAVAININKNAGGAPGKMKANSVLGAIKQKGGKLVTGGSGSLKTKGKGYGTGSGYGVQGIKGRAGARGVAATVVGKPRLMKLKQSEGLTQKQVMDVVKKYSGKISSCYERALLNNPGLSGRIEYEWKILASGKVTWAKVKASNVSGADELNGCVVGIFRGMKFPKAKNGQTTLPSIGFPFGRL